MDIGYLKAFVICGVATCIGTVVHYGPRRLMQTNHPVQGIIGTFVIGGLLGILAYPILRRLGGEWWLWK